MHSTRPWLLALIERQAPFVWRWHEIDCHSTMSPVSRCVSVNGHVCPCMCLKRVHEKSLRQSSIHDLETNVWGYCLCSILILMHNPITRWENKQTQCHPWNLCPPTPVYDIFDDNIKNYINQIGPNIATPRRNGGVTPGFLPKMSVFLWLDHAWKFSQTLRTWQQEESDLADPGRPNDLVLCGWSVLSE